MRNDIFIDDTSIVDSEANIGSGTKIWHFVHVNAGAVIGKNCVLGQNVYVGSKAVIGNNVKVQNNVSIYDNVILEDDVFCGPSVVFTNVHTPRSFINQKDNYLSTVVRQGASIGANATIVCGCNIGRFSFIGAGAVITRDVLDFALMVGVPARQIGWVDKCGKRIDILLAEKNKYIDRNTQEEYELENNRLIIKNEIF